VSPTPYPAAEQHNPAPSEYEAPRSVTALLIGIRVDLVRLGRHLELDPGLWREAQAAFRLSARLADVSRLEARR
jgi:hypothetical protein